MQKKLYRSGDKLLETYFRQIKFYPLLSFNEELELSKKIEAGDNHALHKLINSNLRLVAKIAGAYKKHDLPILDIIQEGNLGLMHAAQKYSYRKNARFCTYASWWIKQFIGRFISNKYRTIRLPMRKEEAFRKIQCAYHTLCQRLMHQPGNSDIAKELGIPVQDVDKIINVASVSTSFEQSVNYADNTAMDDHEDYTYSPERYVMRQFYHDNTLHALNKLKDREKRVLNYRYQLNGCERHTLKEIGDKFDISPETVRQIEIKALRKIRSYANELKDYTYVEAM